MSDHVRIKRDILKYLETDQDKSEWQMRLDSSKYLRNILTRVLTNELDRAILSINGEDTLNSPNYLGKIADNQGYQRGLRKAIDLLSQD